MTNMIIIDILQYILRYQSAETNYFNRCFVLEHRLANEKNYKKKELRDCIIALQSSGFLGELRTPSPLYITNAGKDYLYKHNQSILLRSGSGKLTKFLNKHKIFIYQILISITCEVISDIIIKSIERLLI